MPFDVTQRERRALERGQQSERLVHAIRNLRARRDPLRRRLRFGAALAQRSLLEIHRVVSILAMPPRANQVDRTVHRDPVQPGAKIRPGLETAQLLVRLEPRLLHHVFRILRVPGHPVRKRIDVAGMLFDERAKRVAVAVAGPGDNRRVALVHPCSFDGLGRIRLAWKLTIQGR